jgi:hypothetical protein
MYWNEVTSFRTQSLQNWLAEKRRARTTEPPDISAAPTAMTPPAVW